jgi:hypothetical protein
MFPSPPLWTTKVRNLKHLRTRILRKSESKLQSSARKKTPRARMKTKATKTLNLSYITGPGSVSNWAYTPSEGDTCKGPNGLSLILERIWGELLDAFMDQFWMIANQNISGNFRVHACSSSASSTSNKSDFYTPRASSSNMSSGKWTGEDEREDFPEEDGDGRPKRPNVPSTSTTSFEESAQVACPYRKHDPRKYNFRDWPTCALTPQRTVARVK